MTNRVITQLTNGFGNNIFQYVAAKLLAEHHNLAVYALPAADNYYAVPDFIDLHLGNYHWFIFNIADIFITLGIIGLILVELLKKEKISKNV